MVHFGTSGWRGIIGRDVTFRTVRILTRAILDTLEVPGAPPELVVIGYDTRMLSEKFAQAAAQLIAAAGIRVEVTARDVPTPALSAAVLGRGATFGLTFTGSHNPPEYNGLKLFTADGILAHSDITDRVEARYAELEADWDDTYLPQPWLVSTHDPKPAYLERLQGLIDWEAIRTRGLTIVVDTLFGTTREYLDHILLANDIPISVIHNTRDPYFGGYAPDCTSENLTRLRDVMRRTGAHLGLAADGDGDRFGVLDQGARLLDACQDLALILDYLARRRGFDGGVGRSLATSSLIDAVAEHHGLELVETEVGFKNFGPLIRAGTIEYAGEESAGLAWARHLPERDGLLACLLTAEMVAVEGKSLAELYADLSRRVGRWVFRRTQVPLTRRLVQLLERRMAQTWDQVNGHEVVAVDRRDGLKLVFEGGSWILARQSGTEPKLRLYAQARSREELRYLMHQARQLFTNWRR
jgi:phosphoglucomutase